MKGDLHEHLRFLQARQNVIPQVKACVGTPKLRSITQFSSPLGALIRFTAIPFKILLDKDLQMLK